MLGVVILVNMFGENFLWEGKRKMEGINKRKVWAESIVMMGKETHWTFHPYNGRFLFFSIRRKPALLGK